VETRKPEKRKNHAQNRSTMGEPKHDFCRVKITR
jgi:hypothetical protein